MKVELVSKTVGLNSYAELDNEQLVAAIARHGTIKDDNGKLIKYLMDNAHWSPLQFIQFNFKIQTSRRISAQIFRHQNNHQEWSQRYSKSNEIEPMEMRMEHKTNRQSSTETCGIISKANDMYNVSSTGSAASEKTKEVLVKTAMALEELDACYEELLDVGIAKECAANILPMASTTHIHLGGNLRSLLCFLNVRCDGHAQKEIQDIATAMGELMAEQLPNLMSTLDWRNGMFM